MKQISTKAFICLDDRCGFTYPVAVLEYLLREDESYVYVFTPNYSVIGLLGSDLFQGIPGLNLDLLKPQYVRENRVPVFISERTPGENREDLWALLEECGMDHLNRLEWLIRTKTRYGGDRFYARRWSQEEDKGFVAYEQINDAHARSVDAMRHLLKEICAGKEIRGADFVINDATRKSFHSLLMSLYAKEKSHLDGLRKEGVRKAAEAGKYRGRKPKPIELPKLAEVIEKVRQGRMSIDEAAAALGVSRNTFFRRRRAFEQR